MGRYNEGWAELRESQERPRLLLPGEKPGLSPATRRLALFLVALFALGYVLDAGCVKELI